MTSAQTVARSKLYSIAGLLTRLAGRKVRSGLTAGAGVMPAVRIGRLGPASTPGSPGWGAWWIRRRMYQAPTPNTAKYTSTKATSELATAGAWRGEADSAVRRAP